MPDTGSLKIAPLTVPEWAGMDWLWHGFSTRAGGVSTAYFRADLACGELNLGFTAVDSAENVHENRRRFVERITGASETQLVAVRQVHSHLSVEVGSSGWEMTPEADGMMTRKPGVLLGIQTADCIPVLVVDPVLRAVAGFHAGWRGTVERIVESGVRRMREEFGSEPGMLLAAIGPGIGPCCYAVGAEVVERFEERFAYAADLFTKDGNAIQLDLIEANRRQLLDAGLGAESISIVGGCTSCHPELYFSHRASGGHAGRMMAVVGICA